MASRSHRQVAKKKTSNNNNNSSNNKSNSNNGNNSSRNGKSRPPIKRRWRHATMQPTFANEIFATLGTVVSSDSGNAGRISVGAVLAMDQLIAGAFHLLADAAGRWLRIAGRRTLSVADLAEAVDRVLPRGHAARADYEGRRALARLAASTTAKATATATDRGAPEPGRS